MPRMSPAVSQGQMPSVPSNNPVQSPSYYQRPPSAYAPGQAPVFSNVQNPNGGLALVGVHPGMMPGFNSGHAAQMPHFMGHNPHQQPASTDRPFKCDQCPQSFNRNHDLKRHKRIHLAVKPFPCNHCDKSFSRKDALKVCCDSHIHHSEHFANSVPQRHILVKGCGKAAANSDDVKRESHSPKSEAVESKAIH